MIIETRGGTVHICDENESYFFVSDWDGKVTKFESKAEAKEFAKKDKGEKVVYA